MSLQICDRLFWPNGYTKAFTLSYDDGIRQDEKLIELMNRQGIRGTFNINSGLTGKTNTVADYSGCGKTAEHIKWDARELPLVYSGHEIASHGRFHASMYGMDTLRVTEEVLSCRIELEQILYHPVTGYAYAFGAFNELIISVLQNCHIQYARTIISSGNFEIPGDLLQWNPTCHHDDEKLFEYADNFLSDAPYFSFYSPAKLFYVWGHAYEFDQHDTRDRFSAFLQKIGGKPDVWYATNQEIASYVKAYHQLVFSADSATVDNPSCISVWIGSMFHRNSIEVPPGKAVELLPPVDM